MTGPGTPGDVDAAVVEMRYLPICEPCIAGEGSECHTPECALFLRDVPAEGLIEAFAVLAVDRDTLARWFCAYRYDCAEDANLSPCDHGFGYRDADALLATGFIARAAADPEGPS